MTSVFAYSDILDTFILIECIDSFECEMFAVWKETNKTEIQLSVAILGGVTSGFRRQGGEVLSGKITHILPN